MERVGRGWWQGGFTLSWYRLVTQFYTSASHQFLSQSRIMAVICDWSVDLKQYKESGSPATITIWIGNQKVAFSLGHKPIRGQPPALASGPPRGRQSVNYSRLRREGDFVLLTVNKRVLWFCGDGLGSEIGSKCLNIWPFVICAVRWGRVCVCVCVCVCLQWVKKIKAQGTRNCE